MTRPSSTGKGDDPAGDVTEFASDDAGYSWWRNTHPHGYVLAVRRRREPLLHRARCDDIDPDRHPGRMNAAGSRQLCSASKASLRAWLKVNLPDVTGMLERCPKCSP